MIVKFNKGFRNKYKFPIGFYICKISKYPKKNEYRKGIRTINFRYKHRVYSIFINIYGKSNKS